MFLPGCCQEQQWLARRWCQLWIQSGTCKEKVGHLHKKNDGHLENFFTVTFRDYLVSIISSKLLYSFKILCHFHTSRQTGYSFWSWSWRRPCWCPSAPRPHGTASCRPCTFLVIGITTTPMVLISLQLNMEAPWNWWLSVKKWHIGQRDALNSF